MTAILYPVAKDPDLALTQPMGQAARAREAQDIAGEAVRFVSGPAGPSYATLELAQAACRANLAEAWCQLAERVQAVRPPPPVAPLMENGRRWPAPPLEAPATLWQLQVSYWCPVSAISTTETAQARQARRQVREPVDHQTSVP